MLTKQEGYVELSGSAPTKERRAAKMLVRLVLGVATIGLVGYAALSWQQGKEDKMTAVSRMEEEEAATIELKPQAASFIDCQEWANPSQGGVVQNRKLFATSKSADHFEVEFDFKPTGQSCHWTSVFRVGNYDLQRQPAVFMWPAENKLHIPINACHNCWDQVELAGFGYTLNVEYHVRIIMSQQTAYLWFYPKSQPEPANPTRTVTLKASQIVVANGLNVWVGDPWYNEAPAIVTNVKVCNNPGCNTFLNPSLQPVVRNRRVFTTDKLPQHFDVSFDFKPTGQTAGWTSVMRVGNYNEQRQPAVFMWPGANKLHIPINGCGGGCWDQVEAGGMPYELNVEYHIRILFEYEDVYVWFYKKSDPVPVTPHSYLTIKNSQNFIGGGLNVFVSDPWHPQAPAVVSNLHVCNQPGCRSFINPVLEPLVRNRHLFSVTKTNRFDVRFDFKPTGLTGGWTSVLHVGGVNQERQPGIWMWPGANKLHIPINGCPNCWDQVEAGDFPYTLNTQYSVKIRFDGLKVDVWFYEKSQGEPATPTKTVTLKSSQNIVGKAMPVYVGDPWHPAGPAVVSNLQVCTE